MKRWYCPVCGSGILGPARPHHIATARFCLECSRGEKKLVRRYRAGSLEKARSQAEKELAKAKGRKEARARDRAAEVERDLRDFFTAKLRKKKRAI